MKDTPPLYPVKSPGVHDAGGTHGDLLFSNPLIRSIVDSIPTPFMILDEKRRIVFWNTAVSEIFGGSGSAFGMKPGDFARCTNALQSPGGCGTGKQCSSCGAFLAFMKSAQGDKDLQECRMTRVREGRSESSEFAVCSTPLHLGGRKYVILSFTNISDERRRRVLERTFFHDVMNTAGGLLSILEILENDEVCEDMKMLGLIRVSVSSIIDEINTFRILVSAESNDLPVIPNEVAAGELIRELVEFYRRNDFVQKRDIRFLTETEPVSLVTDRTLLRRVISNMIKNAVEASAEQGTVTIRCRKNGDTVSFSVHNASYIPEDVRIHIFQRSFSTKGQGRGIGTYSIRLLTENYLKGNVSFTSSEEEGTTFMVVYPLSIV